MVMKKKEARKLQVGDLLVVTGDRFGTGPFALGTKVRVVNVRNKQGDTSVDKQGVIEILPRQDLSLPEKSPCEKLGYKVGNSFKVVDGKDHFGIGSIVELIEDDRSPLPLFKLVIGSCSNRDDKAYLCIENVKPYIIPAAMVVSGYSGDPDSRDSKMLKVVNISELPVGTKLYPEKLV